MKDVSGTMSGSAPFDVEQWIHLNSGDTVIIQRAGEAPNTGQIDEVNEEATMFWVLLDQGRGRILVHAGDESLVYKLF